MSKKDGKLRKQPGLIKYDRDFKFFLNCRVDNNVSLSAMDLGSSVKGLGLVELNLEEAEDFFWNCLAEVRKAKKRLENV